MESTIARKTVDVYRTVASSALNLRIVVLIAVATLVAGVLIGLALAGLFGGAASPFASLAGAGSTSVPQGGR